MPKQATKRRETEATTTLIGDGFGVNRKRGFCPNDDHETPPEIWRLIIPYVDHDWRVWDPFYCSGLASKALKEIFDTVIHKKEDVFETTVKRKEYDLIVTNPPFHNKAKFLQLLVSFRKPMILLLPFEVMGRLWFREIFRKVMHKMSWLVPPTNMGFIYKGKRMGRAPFTYGLLFVDIGLPHPITDGRWIDKDNQRRLPWDVALPPRLDAYHGKTWSEKEQRKLYQQIRDATKG